MRARRIARLAASALAAWLAFSAESVLAQGAPPVLSGTVASDREGPMEGVLVSAKKQGSTITVTVVSDAKGAYAFPAGRLEPGSYKLAIRASGYALDGADTVALAAGNAATANLKLKPSPVQFEQLTNAEMLVSAPGPVELKRNLLNCSDCHSLHRVFGSKHNRADFMKVFERMGGYYPGASDLQPPRLGGAH